MRGVDIRSQGSGNTGATNTARVLGKGAGLLTLLLDISKGTFSAYCGSIVDARVLTYSNTLPGHQIEPFWACTAGILSLLGHCFSPFLKGRGGKGVATGLGIFFFLSPLAAWLAISVFVTAIRIFRIVSISSILAAVTIPLVVIFEPKGSPMMLIVASLVASTLVILKHQSNIRRLIAGTEPRWGKPKAGAPSSPPAST